MLMKTLHEGSKIRIAAVEGVRIHYRGERKD